MSKQGNERGARLGYRSKAAAAGWVKCEGILVFSPDLSDGALRCLQAIRWHVGPNEVAWPGQATLAEELRRSERQVQRHIAELKDLGLLTVAPRGQGRTADYILEDIPQRLIDSALIPGWFTRTVKNGGSGSDPPRTSVLGRTRQSVLERTTRAAPSNTNLDPTEEDPTNAGEKFDDSNIGDGAPYSAYIAGVVLDLARESLPGQAAPAVVKHVLALWQRSGLPEGEFVLLLHLVRADLRAQQAKIVNRVAWFYAAVGRAIEERKGGEENG